MAWAAAPGAAQAAGRCTQGFQHAGRCAVDNGELLWLPPVSTEFAAVHRRPAIKRQCCVPPARQVLGYHCSEQVYMSLEQLLGAGKVESVIQQSIAVANS